jgi:indole-3-glycerol phosphate synthase
MYFGRNRGSIPDKIKRAARERNPIIAEIKTYSPIYGDLLRGRNVFKILEAYENAGVSGISYITAKKFRGDFETFKQICRKTSLPVLRKDFILTLDEVERTAEAEASAILLIARMLKNKTAEFVDFSFEHGLDTLVEVHTVEDIPFVKESKTTMVGINNRDILCLERDSGNVSVTEKIAPHLRDVIKISASGIFNLRDLAIALRYTDAALIGTAFMMAENTEEFVKIFVEAKLC